MIDEKGCPPYRISGLIDALQEKMKKNGDVFVSIKTKRRHYFIEGFETMFDDSGCEHLCLITFGK